MSQHWANIGESTFVVGIRLLQGVHHYLGRLPFRLCLLPVVLYYWLTRPLARRASAQYLQRLHASQQCFDSVPGIGHSFRHLLRFAETVLDKVLAMGGDYRADKLPFQGHETMFAESRAGRGAVLVTAHMGCLELLQVAADHRAGLRITMLVHTAHAEQFNRLRRRVNPQATVHFMQVADFSPVTAVLLAERVAAGELIAIAGDRVPVHGDRVVWVPFLGHPAPLPIGPYLLASLLGCPAYCISCLHQSNGGGGDYQVDIHKLADRVILPRASRELALAAYASEFARWMETQLHRSPYDWFNFFPFWDQTTHATDSN